MSSEATGEHVTTSLDEPLRSIPLQPRSYTPRATPSCGGSGPAAEVAEAEPVDRGAGHGPRARQVGPSPSAAPTAGLPPGGQPLGADTRIASSCSRRFARPPPTLGVEGVRLYHDQGLVKEPGGGDTPWHQDRYYWPLDTERTVTLWMPLVDVPAEIGTMTFARGTHLPATSGALRSATFPGALAEQSPGLGLPRTPMGRSPRATPPSTAAGRAPGAGQPHGPHAS